MYRKNEIDKISGDMLTIIERRPEEDLIKQIDNVKDIEQTDRDGRTLLISASAYGRIGVVKYLLERKSNVNAKDKMGFTSLHMATQYGHIEIIELLIKNGADINAQNAFGNTPIFYAPNQDAIEICKLLMKYGADPTIKNEYDVSPLDSFIANPEVQKVMKT